MLKELLQKLRDQRRIIKYIKILNSENASKHYSQEELDFMLNYIKEHVKVKKEAKINEVRMIYPDKRVEKKSNNIKRHYYRSDDSLSNYRTPNPDDIRGNVYHYDKQRITNKEYKQLQRFFDNL